MPSFQAMFEESKGQPVAYQGHTLVLGDFCPTQGATRFRLVVESCKATRRQGVALDLVHRGQNGKWRRGASPTHDGEFVVNGQVCSGRKGIFFWQEDVPGSVEFEVRGDPDGVDVFNVWEGQNHLGKRFMDSRRHGAAMMVEELPNGRRYRCNDGEPDEDFDDIVFRLERVA